MSAYHKTYPKRASRDNWSPNQRFLTEWRPKPMKYEPTDRDGYHPPRRGNYEPTSRYSYRPNRRGNDEYTNRNSWQSTRWYNEDFAEIEDYEYCRTQERYSQHTPVQDEDELPRFHENGSVKKFLHEFEEYRKRMDVDMNTARILFHYALEDLPVQWWETAGKFICPQKGETEYQVMAALLRRWYQLSDEDIEQNIEESAQRKNERYLREIPERDNSEKALPELKEEIRIAKPSPSQQVEEKEAAQTICDTSESEKVTTSEPVLEKPERNEEEALLKESKPSTKIDENKSAQPECGAAGNETAKMSERIPVKPVTKSPRVYKNGTVKKASKSTFQSKSNEGAKTPPKVNVIGKSKGAKSAGHLKMRSKQGTVRTVKFVQHEKTPSRCYSDTYVAMATNKDATKTVQNLHRTKFNKKVSAVDRTPKQLSAVKTGKNAEQTPIPSRRKQPKRQTPSVNYDRESEQQNTFTSQERWTPATRIRKKEAYKHRPPRKRLRKLKDPAPPPSSLTTPAKRTMDIHPSWKSNLRLKQDR